MRSPLPIKMPQSLPLNSYRRSSFSSRSTVIFHLHLFVGIGIKGLFACVSRHSGDAKCFFRHINRRGRKAQILRLPLMMTACCAASRLDFSLGIPPLPVRRGTLEEKSIRSAKKREVKQCRRSKPRVGRRRMEVGERRGSR